MEKSITASRRNYGIDFLRILSMYMVVVLHILGYGGILSKTTWMSGQYVTAWALEIAAYCAVNCFGLISGYVGCESTFRWSKLLSLWLQVLFFSLGITALFAIVMPQNVYLEDWIRSFLPVTTRSYWYITAYVGMFLLMPFLNIVIQKAEKKQVIVFSVVASVVVLIMPIIPLSDDPYRLNDGYSMLWLCILYLLGGWIRRYGVDQKIKKSHALISFIASTAFVLLSKIVLEMSTTRFLGSAQYGELLISFTSPFVVVNAGALLCFFSSVEFKKHTIKNSIRMLSPAALGVYLIHVHPMMWNYVIQGSTRSFANFSPFWLVLSVLGSALAIYLGCSLIEILRLKLFSLLSIPKKLKIVDEKIDKIRI